MSGINQIMKNDWYKTASKKEMRIALMHMEMEASDRTMNKLNECQKTIRDNMFEQCMTDIGHGENIKGDL